MWTVLTYPYGIYICKTRAECIMHYDILNVKVIPARRADTHASSNNMRIMNQEAVRWKVNFAQYIVAAS